LVSRDPVSAAAVADQVPGEKDQAGRGRVESPEAAHQPGLISPPPEASGAALLALSSTDPAEQGHPATS
jgi:hypothetical protein